MSSISALGRNLYSNYEALSSGKRINSAADDAAGLAIAQKMEVQVNGYDVGRDNAKTSQNMLNVADGALSGIADSLQRMSELGIQAMNGLYSDSDRRMIQAEIDQLKEGIAGIAGRTQFNEMNLLNGSVTSSRVATDSNGAGVELAIPNATLEALGIADFDVTKGSFDLSVIDKALETVNSARGKLGADYNSLDHVVAYNSLASYNMSASQSRVEDQDMFKGISDLKKNQLLQTTAFIMQKKKQEEEQRKTAFFV